MSTPPWEQIIDHIFSEFKLRIDSFHNAAVHQPAIKLAKTLVRLRKLCRESKRQVCEHSALKYYLFYVYHFQASMPSSTPTRFCDGLFGVKLLTGLYGDGPSDHGAFDHLQTRYLVSDRVKQANTLSGPTFTPSEVVKQCGKYLAPDLPGAVGPRVAALVGRARFVTQRIRLVRPSVFTACAVCGCHTVAAATFFSTGAGGGGMDSAGSADESDDDDDDDDDDAPAAAPVSSYWRLCHPTTPFVFNVGAVCSLECEVAAKDEIEEALPVKYERLESEEDYMLRKKTGLARVLALHTETFKRNRAVARQLRATARSPRRKAVLSEASFRQIRGDIVKTLNIDTVLVMAAASIAISKSLSRMRPLPGGLRWRDHNWRRALAIARHRFSEYTSKKIAAAKKRSFEPTDEKLITDELNLPKWATSVVDDALKLFPIHSPTV